MHPVPPVSQPEVSRTSPLPKSKMDLEAHIKREWVTSPRLSIQAPAENTNAFGVVSYNILADCHMNPGDWPYCPESARKSEERHKQLMVELQHDIYSTDIICLQEVGPKYFKEHLQPSLVQLGFTASFAKKQHGTDEGVATFYRGQRFSLLDERKVSCTELIREAAVRAGLSPTEIDKLFPRADKDNVVIFSRLLDVVTRNVISIGNIHATFSDYKFIDVGSLQIISAFNGLIEFAGGLEEAIIFCGDFNTEPHLPGYQLMQDGRLSEESAQYLRRHHKMYAGDPTEKAECLVDIATPCFQHKCTSIRSAYKDVMGCEPPFTTHDDIMGLTWPATHADRTPEEVPQDDQGIYRSDPDKFGTQLCKGCVDYQCFNSNRLHCLRVLRTVDEFVIERFHSLPNRVFPSDHLLLKASYSFV